MLSSISRFIVGSPICRATVPNLIGALIGFFIAILVPELTVPTGFDWSHLLNSWMTYMILFLVILASLYQAKVSKFDKTEQNVLERAKEAQAANIGEFYAARIKAGEIAELQEADAVMKKIFQSEKKK
jgi:hypothetical protein